MFKTLPHKRGKSIPGFPVPVLFLIYLQPFTGNEPSLGTNSYPFELENLMTRHVFFRQDLIRPFRFSTVSLKAGSFVIFSSTLLME